MASNFLESNGEFEECFPEDSGFTRGSLKKLFVLATIDGQVRNPSALWEDFQADILEVCEYQSSRDSGEISVLSEDISDCGLYLI